MKERPIIFSAPMVRAILEGRKTQTRRVVKWPIYSESDGHKRRVFTDFDAEELNGLLSTKHQHPCSRPACKWRAGCRLWVREAFTYIEREESDRPKRGESINYRNGEKFGRYCERLSHDGEDYLVYKADGCARSIATFADPVYEHCIGRFGKTISPVHMPRWASRITLEVEAVRVERLNDIHIDDIEREGLRDGEDFDSSEMQFWEAFRYLWDSINGKSHPWDANPWVWAITFRRID